MSTADIDEALYYLKLIWGDEWELGHDPAKGFWGRRRGADGNPLEGAPEVTAPSPEELGRKLEDAAGSRQ